MSAKTPAPSAPTDSQVCRNFSPSRSRVDWDFVSEKALLGAIMKHNAYKRVSKKGLDKWAKVADELNSNSNLDKYFGEEGVLINGETCKKKWQRMKKAVEEKYAITAVEGANLSAYSDASVHENDKLIITILEESAMTDKEKEEKTDKERKRDASMLADEDFVLTHKKLKVMKEDDDDDDNDDDGEDEVVMNVLCSDSSGCSSSDNDNKKKTTQNVTAAVDLTMMMDHLIKSLQKDPKLVEAEIKAMEKKTEHDAKMCAAFQTLADAMQSISVLLETAIMKK